MHVQFWEFNLSWSSSSLKALIPNENSSKNREVQYLMTEKIKQPTSTEDTNWGLEVKWWRPSLSIHRCFLAANRSILIHILTNIHWVTMCTERERRSNNSRLRNWMMLLFSVYNDSTVSATFIFAKLQSPDSTVWRRFRLGQDRLVSFSLMNVSSLTPSHSFTSELLYNDVDQRRRTI